MAMPAVRWFALSVLVVIVATGCSALMGGDPRSTCIDDRMLPINSTFFEEIGDTDCNVDGLPRDQFNIKLTSPQVLRISTTSQVAMLHSLVVTRKTTGGEEEVVREEGTTDRFLYVALGPGDHVLYFGATGDDRGAYSLTSESLVAPNPLNCVTSPTRFFYVGRGSRVDGSITAGDCNAVGGTRDGFTILAKAGQSYTLTLTPSVATSVEVLDNLDVEASATAPAGQATAVTFSVASSRRLTIWLTSSASGTYSLSID
jgi:hypothetical protein